MSKSLGNILHKLRKEKGLNQKMLSKGLCSISSLSRFEVGEREPDQLLFECLISRLGKDSTRWELIISERDKKLLEKRNYIEYLMKTEQWELVEKEIKQYKNFKGLSKPPHEQYVLLVYGLLYRQKKEYEKAIEKCFLALEKTKIVLDKEELVIQEKVLSKNELRILCVIGELLLEGEFEHSATLYNYWSKILQYIELKSTDEQYRIEFYGRIYYHLAYLAYREKQYRRSVFCCKKGLEELVKKRSLSYVKQLIDLINCLEGKYDISPILEMASLEEWNFLKHTLEYWEEKNKSMQQKPEYIRLYNGTYSVNEVIRNMRKYYGKTQEDLMENSDGEMILSNQSSLSKIETGKRKPNYTTRQNYFELLGLEGREDGYQLGIQGEDFEIQELRSKIDFYISLHQAEEAEEILWQLKERIDLDNPYNEQYVRKVELFIRDELIGVSCEEYEQEIFSILALTMPDIEKIKQGGEEKRFLTKEEIILLMNLGCAYHKDGNYEKARYYYQRIERYFCEIYPFANAGIYKTLLYNLSQVYGLLGDYEQAIEKSEACIFFELFYDNSYSLGRSLYNIGWCYGKMMEMEQDFQKKEEHKKACSYYFCQSYSIVKCYKDYVGKKAIEEKRTLWNL